MKSVFRVGVPIAFAVLFFFTRINGAFWPLSWPDEALFSSPAATLASEGRFATPVLQGLIPGMETATLWNSPLYMVLLSGVYLFSGESQTVARGMSLLFALPTLFIFERCLAFFVSSVSLRFLITLLLCFDLTFLRAANTARMDMLTMLWFVSCFYFLLFERSNRDGLSSKASFFLAGLCMGLAGISHPIGVVLIVPVLVFSLPRIGLCLHAASGTALAFLPWIVYISGHYAIFEAQFLSQLFRKTDMFRIWGGDTGGVLVVFASQYGGGRAVMLGAVFATALVFLAGGVYCALRRGEWRRDLFFRLYGSSVCVFALLLLASEAWYALYAGPLFLFLSGYLAAKANTFWHRFALGAVGLFFCGSFLAFTVRHHAVYGTPGEVDRFNAAQLSSLRGCSSVYLRVRPDPYFLARKMYPDMEILEFIPGKLRLPDSDQQKLFSRYERIQCFLLDDHGDWEPRLTTYLKDNQDRFRRIRLEAKTPLENATLWRREE